MSPERIEFDDARAGTYEKRAEVLAFQSPDAFRFSKSWGEQECRPGSWILVPVDGSGAPSRVAEVGLRVAGSSTTRARSAGCRVYSPSVAASEVGLVEWALPSTLSSRKR